jgi:DNA-binding CsgD family transcriptional regulator
MPRKPSHHGSDWTPSDDRKLSKLRAGGASGNEIARALGRTRASIYQHLTTRRRKRKSR